MSTNQQPRRRGLRTWTALATLCATIALGAGPAAAEAAQGVETKFKIDDQDPESAVPTWDDAMKQPLQMGYWVMLVSERAQKAVKAGDHAKAVKYYRALAKAVPDRSTGYAKMCEEYEALGDWKLAVDSCQAALTKKGVTAKDSIRFVRMLLQKQERLVATEIADVDAVIAHLDTELAKPPAPAEGEPARVFDPVQRKQEERENRILVNQLRCELGLLLEDTQRLEACSSALAADAPRDPRTISFSWALAVARSDFGEAERLIDVARSAGINETAIETMQGRLIVERENRTVLGRIKRASSDARFWGASALVLGLAAIAAEISRRRRLRPRTVRHA
jgi:hypothetical protein